MPINPSGKLRAALAELVAGKVIILTDDEDRENEGDLCVAAEHATPEAINFMAVHGRGLICLALPESRTRELGLSLLVPPEANQTAHSTPFCMPVDARAGVTTGISAPDRAEAVRVALAPETCPEDLVAPGHLPVLSARPGGVLERSGPYRSLRGSGTARWPQPRRSDLRNHEPRRRHGRPSTTSNGWQRHLT